MEEGQRTRLFRLLTTARWATVRPLLSFLLDEYLRAPEPALVTLHRGADADLHAAVRPRLQGDGWMLVDVLLGRGASPASRHLFEALHAHAVVHDRTAVIERLAKLLARMNEPPVAEPAKLAERPLASKAATARPSREELYRTVQGGALEAARRALTLLAEEPEPRLVALPGRARGPSRATPSPSRAPPASRLRLAREYLAASLRLLDDPLADIRRTAVRIVGFARMTDAAKKLVGLVDDEHPAVRREATEALGRLGPDAKKALEHALAAAGPDKRAPLERILAKLSLTAPRA